MAGQAVLLVVSAPPFAESKRADMSGVEPRTAASPRYMQRVSPMSSDC